MYWLRDAPHEMERIAGLTQKVLQAERGGRVKAISKDAIF